MWTNDDATSGWGATTTPRDNGGWGTGNSEAHKDGGWGTGNSGGHKDSGGWGTSNSGGHGGWGTDNSGGPTASGAWGSTNANIAKISEEANSKHADAGGSKGWDQPTTSSFGSWTSLERGKQDSSDAHKDKRDGKTKDDIQMRDPSPPRKQDEPKPKSAQPILESPPKHPAESPAQTPLSPKYVSPLSAPSTKLSPDLKSLALEVARPKGIPMKIKGREGRKALYHSTIKSVTPYFLLRMLTYDTLFRHTKNAIISYIEHREAQTDLNRWKDTQMSSIYGHATQKTRKILDSERATFHRRLQDVEDTFQKEINALVNLPELPTTGNKRKSKVLTKEVIAEYTQELQDWFKDLELHKRLLMDGETEEGEIADEKEEGEVNDSEEENTGQRISELLRGAQWTWKGLTEGYWCYGNSI
jgi:hypothetical protein